MFVKETAELVGGVTDHRLTGKINKHKADQNVKCGIVRITVAREDGR
jgi:hypothetical protein